MFKCYVYNNVILEKNAEVKECDFLGFNVKYFV